MRSVRISVDRLIVEGLAPSQQRQFLVELERQLHEFARGGLAQSLEGGGRRRFGAIDAGVLRPGAGPAQAAAQIVQGLRGAVGGARGDHGRGSEGGGHV